MALIIVAGDKGSPGVTTAAVALAAAWPRHAILAECDPHGGDLVYRLAAEQGGPLDPNTGLLSVAIAARRGFDARAIPQHLQRVHGGLDVLVGLGTAEQAAAVTGQWSRLARAFDQFAALPEGGDVIADCGRVGPSSPALELMPHAALVLLIARADAEQVAHVRDRANGLSQALHGNQGATASIARPPIGVVLIAKHREAKKVAHQVGDLLSATAGGAEVLGVLAEDPEGAAALCGRVHARVDKSLLMRSARDLANSVTARYALLRQQPPAAAAHTAPPRSSAPGAGPAASAAAAQSYQYPSAHAAASSGAPPPSAAETTAPMPPIRDAYAPPVAPIYSAPQPWSADQQSYQYSQRPQYGQQSAQPQHQSRYPQYPQSAANYYQDQAQPQGQSQAQNHAAHQPPTAAQTPATVTLTPKLQPQQPQQPHQPQSQPEPADGWPIRDAVPTTASAAASPASPPAPQPQLNLEPEPAPAAHTPEPAISAEDPAEPSAAPAAPDRSSTPDSDVADLADAAPVSTGSGGTVQP